MDTPLSESSVSLKLEEIQRRCSELISQPESLLELSLEDAEPGSPCGDPYNQLKP